MICESPVNSRGLVSVKQAVARCFCLILFHILSTLCHFFPLLYSPFSLFLFLLHLEAISILAARQQRGNTARGENRPTVPRLCPTHTHTRRHTRVYNSIVLTSWQKDTSVFPRQHVCKFSDTVVHFVCGYFLKTILKTYEKATHKNTLETGIGTPLFSFLFLLWQLCGFSQTIAHVNVCVNDKCMEEWWCMWLNIYLVFYCDFFGLRLPEITSNSSPNT